MRLTRRGAWSPKESAAWRCGGLPGPAGGRGGRMVRAVPGRGTEDPPGHLPAESAVARAVGEGPRRWGTGGEGIPRQPRGSWRCRAGHAAAWRRGRSGRFPSARSAPGQRRPGRLDAGTQKAAYQPVPAGQRVDRGARPGLGPQPQCKVELTEIRVHGQHWWTLGFEATGPASLLRSELQAAAALVFAQALPGGVEPGPDESRSYAQWLGQPPRAGSDAGAAEDCRSAGVLKTDPPRARAARRGAGGVAEPLPVGQAGRVLPVAELEACLHRGSHRLPTRRRQCRAS